MEQLNYFIHCKKTNVYALQQNKYGRWKWISKIGKAMHEEKKTDEITVENIKVDKIKKDYL